MTATLAEDPSFPSMCGCLWLPLIFAMHLLHHFHNIPKGVCQTPNVSSGFPTQLSLRISGGRTEKKKKKIRKKEILAPSSPSAENITQLGYYPKVLTSHPRDQHNAFGSEQARAERGKGGGTAIIQEQEKLSHPVVPRAHFHFIIYFSPVHPFAPACEVLGKGRALRRGLKEKTVVGRDGGCPRRRLSVIRNHPQVKPIAHPELLFPNAMKTWGRRYYCIKIFYNMLEIVSWSIQFIE